MNYLAHVFLSGDDEDIIIGNFIADFIHGNRFKNFNPDIQKGILLHRQIDFYTDSHPAFRRCKKRLFKDFRHYSGVVIDMFFDHFLAKHFSKYHPIPLELFVNDFYSLLEENKSILPIKVKQILPPMLTHNWLYHYKDLEHLRRVLNQMNNKTKHETSLHEAVDILIENYEDFETDFFIFMKDIIAERDKMFYTLDIA